VILLSQQYFYQIDKQLSNYILVLIPCAHLNSFLCNLICFVLNDPPLSQSFLSLIRKSHSLVVLMMNVPHEQMDCFGYSKIYCFQPRFRRKVWRSRHIYFVNWKEFLFVILVEFIILLLFRIVVLAFDSSKKF
jgi:hypothetical protein